MARALGWLAAAAALAWALPSAKEFTFRGDIAKVAFAGEDQEAALLVLTIANGLYQEADEGGFKPVNLQLLCPPGAQTLDDVRVSAFDSDVVVVLGKKCAFASDSAGDEWNALEIPPPPSQGAKWGQTVDQVMFHPWQSQWLLVTTKTQGCYEKGSECFATAFVTRDLGRTFKLLRTHVQQIDWATSREDHPDDQILAAIPRSKTHQVLGEWNYKVDLVATVDDFRTHHLLVEHGNMFAARDMFVFAGQVDATNNVKLLVRSPNVDGGKRFVDAKLPLKMKQRAFRVLDTRFGHVFVHVSHHNAEVSFGNIYSSDATGANFSLSLPYALVDAQGRVDFSLVEGLEGSYIANIVANADSVEKTIAMGQAKPPVQLRTMFTMDQGRQWSALRGPSKDCVFPLCSLHLTGLASAKGRVLSSRAAVGILMATGNEGQYLFDMHRGMNTYLSRDGGLTWELARQGSRVFEIGNHGNVLVAANDAVPTNKVEYSLDQGLSWLTYEFCKTPVTVTQVIAQPTESVFYVVGIREASFGSGGAVWTLDLSKERNRSCQGREVGQVGSDQSDFEIFAPGQGQCLMGRKVELVRRKRQAECYTDDDDDQVLELTSICPCSAADYECDVGYFRSEDWLGGRCVRDVDVDINYTFAEPRHCPAGSTYTISRGYRRIAGDSCALMEIMNEFEPDLVRCRRHSLLGVGLRGWAVLFVFGALAWTMWNQRASIRCRMWLTEAMFVGANNALGRFGYHQIERIPEVADSYGDEFEWASDDEVAGNKGHSDFLDEEEDMRRRRRRRHSGSGFASRDESDEDGGDDV